MPNVKTVTLTGGETVVTFEDSYPYYMITNMGNSEIYASGNPGIEPYADGVYTIPRGRGDTHISRIRKKYHISFRQRQGTGTRRRDRCADFF